MTNRFPLGKMLTFLFFAVVLTLPSHAQPVRNKVLGEVRMEREDDLVIVLVTFNFPIQYISHFPSDKGDELRIKLIPVVVGLQDRNPVIQRETYTPPGDNEALIEEVSYEGDIVGGPYLTVLFKDRESFHVSQGADFRSIRIEVVKKGDAPSSHNGSEPESK